ncbi:MAG: metal-dependent transcriptional regulator, partial [bacterium]|nr:metal-dependent transcriptional regulator [bacterium]
NKIQENSRVKAIDISRELGVSRASVTEALNRLAEKGFINYEKYGSVLITDMGVEKAKQIVSLHKELTEFFINLGIDNTEAETTACKIEHIVSDKIKERVLAFNKFVKNNPDFKF